MPHNLIWKRQLGILSTLSFYGGLKNEFEIHNTGNYIGIADIVVIPEPASIFLLSLGLLAVRKKLAIKRV